MNVYLARQPIFNRKKEVVAYELLFRSSESNAFDGSDSTIATLQVIKNSFSLFGLESIVGDKKAFLNFDENLLKSGLVEIFKTEFVVIEILETVELTEEVVVSIKNIKAKGYEIALDDFEYDDKYASVMDYIDYIKVDFVNTKGIDRKNVISNLNNSKLKFLAEKVETEEEFNYALECGYSYFQGYFFCKPIIIATQEVFTNKFNFLGVIEELNKDSINIDKVEDLIKKDLGLSYKLLRLINSASYGIRTEITSIRQAVLLIGATDLKKWLYVITLKSLNEGKPDALVKTSLVRARFGELVAESADLNVNSFDMFLAGMFSLIDCVMNMPMNVIVKELPVSDNVKNTLNGLENKNTDLLRVIEQYERGNWRALNENLDSFKIRGDELLIYYLRAIEWVEKINF